MSQFENLQSKLDPNNKYIAWVHSSRECIALESTSCRTALLRVCDFRLSPDNECERENCNHSLNLLSNMFGFFGRVRAQNTNKSK